MLGFSVRSAVNAVTVGLWFLGVCAFGCGRVRTPYPPDGAPDSAILALTVTPPTSALTWPATLQATAMAMYDDGTTRDVTSAATWSSSDMSVASVAAGVVASADFGSAVIQAALGGYQSSTTVAVTVPTLAVLSYDDMRAGNIAGIDFFPANATGNTPPLRSIRGSATTFDFLPYGMAGHGEELFVICGDINSGISVFPTGGSGNIAPLRRIAGAKTTLSSSIAFSVSDTEIVTTGQNSVLTFPTNGDGNIAPTRTITGSATKLQEALSAVVVNDEIYVADFVNQLVAVFPMNATGNVAPVRTIEGASTHLASPIVAQVFNDEIYVATSSNSIVVFPIAASGNAAPIRTIKGPLTQIAGANMLAVAGDLLFVANRNDGVLVFKTSDTGNVAPQRVLSGPATHIHQPTSIALF